MRIALRADHKPRLFRWRLQDGEKHRGVRVFSEGPIFSIFYYAHHFDARSVPHLVVCAHGMGSGAKDLARKFLVDDGHAWRIFIIVPSEGPARQQDSARRVEVIGRYV